MSPTKVTHRNSAVNKEDNLHDVNDGLTPSKSTANPNIVESGCELIERRCGNIPVWVKLYGVPVTAFSEDGLSADMELKDNIVVAMPKLVGEGFYTCNVRVEYEWKHSRCACCKVFGHVQDECPKNIDSNVVKNMKKLSQTPRGVSVGPKVGFKPTKQVYRQVPKKNNVNTSGNKKKDAEPTIAVSNSNPFDVLNSVENDIDLGTDGGTSNLAMERLIIDGKVTLIDDEGKPLIIVDSSGDHDSKDEVASDDNDMANFRASKEVGYGTNSLLEQWKESYINGDYDFDPYDDDVYEGQDIPDKMQDICDSLDIKVRGRKKK
ncbi:hypothetical protein Tco_0730930 [Tanacetum coccineum]